MVGIQLDNYKVAINPQKDANGKITCGFVIGDILRQNQAILLAQHKGENKERPELGVGITDMLLDNDPLYWRTVIRETLELDGQKVDTISVSDSNISIESSYRQ